MLFNFVYSSTCKISSLKCKILHFHPLEILLEKPYNFLQSTVKGNLLLSCFSSVIFSLLIEALSTSEGHNLNYKQYNI